MPAYTPVISLFDVEPQKRQPKQNAGTGKDDNHTKQRSRNVLHLIYGDFTI